MNHIHEATHGINSCFFFFFSKKRANIKIIYRYQNYIRFIESRLFYDFAFHSLTEQKNIPHPLFKKHKYNTANIHLEEKELKKESFLPFKDCKNTMGGTYIESIQE